MVFIHFIFDFTKGFADFLFKTFKKNLAKSIT
jgi:hypothetical protein